VIKTGICRCPECGQVHVMYAEEEVESFEFPCDNCKAWLKYRPKDYEPDWDARNKDKPLDEE
jgi:transcription initiation factor TFIIIB Brf1 subunit/transcription initiation factor TFIIB